MGTIQTIKTTYGNIVNSTEAINTLLTSDVAYGTALQLHKNAKELQKCLEDYQAEEKKLIDLYFEKDEDGNLIQNESGGYKLIPEKVKDYITDKQTLDAFEVELRLYKLAFDDIKDVKIKPIQVPAIAFMVDDLPDEE